MNKMLTLKNEKQKNKSKKKAERVFQTLTIIFLSLLALAQLFPFYLKLIDSLHNTEFIPKFGKLYLWPEAATLKNYSYALTRGGLLNGLKNSLIHTLSFTTISLVIALIVGYVLGKLKFRGKKIVTALLISTMMIPGEILMVPNYLLVMQLGWNMSLLGIILPGIVNVFGIFLVKQYMSNIPDAVLESAEIDGCNELQKIFRIVLPMARPIIITYIILTFTSTWNEYLFPMIVLKDPALFTLQLTMYQFYPKFGGYADGYIRSAGMILITLPIMIMYVIFQKYFLEQGNISGLK